MAIAEAAVKVIFRERIAMSGATAKGRIFRFRLQGGCRAPT
jgi:hypothetical protein